MKKIWVYDPHSGGSKLSSQHQEEICKQVTTFAKKRLWYPKVQLKVRFKNQFCYVYTIESGDDRELPLCRLRHFQTDWSMALFTYSNDTYQPCAFPDGKQTGTLVAALELCEEFIV